jgi:hypothetical protein
MSVKMEISGVIGHEMTTLQGSVMPDEDWTKYCVQSLREESM